MYEDRAQPRGDGLKQYRHLLAQPSSSPSTMTTFDIYSDQHKPTRGFPLTPTTNLTSGFIGIPPTSHHLEAPAIRGFQPVRQPDGTNGGRSQTAKTVWCFESQNSMTRLGLSRNYVNKRGRVRVVVGFGGLHVEQLCDSLYTCKYPSPALLFLEFLSPHHLNPTFLPCNLSGG